MDQSINPITIVGIGWTILHFAWLSYEKFKFRRKIAKDGRVSRSELRKLRIRVTFALILITAVSFAIITILNTLLSEGNSIIFPVLFYSLVLWILSMSSIWVSFDPLPNVNSEDKKE